MRRFVVSSYEGAEAAVLLVAGLAALEVRAHAGDKLVGARGAVLELDLDVAVELIEALLAGQLGLGGAQEASQDVVWSVGVLGHAWPSACSRRRSLWRASWMVL
jgi:hypothetical protein